MFSSKPIEVNDVNVLHSKLRGVYLQPEKALGLDKGKMNLEALRSVFRKNCIALMSEFTNSGKPKLDAEQLILAYHLSRGTIKTTANKIKETMENSPYFDFKPNYMLPVLRPLKSNMKYNREFRGFRLLAIIYKSYVLEREYLLIWKARFTFTIEYVLRRHKITKTYEDFIEFHKALESEMLVIPTFPSPSLSAEVLGQQLQEYLLRIHNSLADRGVFSPRLMAFLEVDYEQVQTEEEGAFVMALDSRFLPRNTVWYCIDEKWLDNWRTYVRGRPPRRYFPPGSIDNRRILQSWKQYDDALKKAAQEKEDDLGTGNANGDDEKDGGGGGGGGEGAAAIAEHKRMIQELLSKNFEAEAKRALDEYSDDELAGSDVADDFNEENNDEQKDEAMNAEVKLPTRSYATRSVMSGTRFSSASESDNNGNDDYDDKFDAIKLQAVQDYRCVNFNVWQFLHMVHGGGPVIGRELQSLYSNVAYSFLQAVVMIQTRMRMFLSHKRLKIMLAAKLSSTLAGKFFLFNYCMQKISDRATERIEENRRERVKKNLDNAALFTQGLWRVKKKYSIEENLKQKQKQQDAFKVLDAFTPKDVDVSVEDAIVVVEYKPVIQLGNVSIYNRILPSGDGGLPFTLQKNVGTEEAIIKRAADETLFFPGSVLLTINGLPTNSMDYDMIKSILSQATFPLNLELEKPVNPRLLPSFDNVVDFTKKQKDFVTYSAFKLSLLRGVRVIKHNLRNASSHRTILKITDCCLLYRSKSDEWVRFSLFDLKFVRSGKESELVEVKRIDASRAFEIAMEDRTLTFALVKPSEMETWLKDELKLLRASEANNELDRKLFRDGRGIEVLTRGAKPGRTFSSRQEADKLEELNLQSHRLREERELVEKELVDLYVTKGLKPPDNVGKHNKRIAAMMSPRMFVGGNALDAKEDIDAMMSIMVDCFRKLVNEVRGTQVFVNKDGVPVRRRKQKAALKKVEV